MGFVRCPDGGGGWGVPSDGMEPLTVFVGLVWAVLALLLLALLAGLGYGAYRVVKALRPRQDQGATEDRGNVSA